MTTNVVDSTGRHPACQRITAEVRSWPGRGWPGPARRVRVHRRGPPTRPRARRPRGWARPMRVIEVTRFGGPEVLELREQPDPVAGPGQVVVDVAAIPLLWLDTALRSGKGRDWFAVEPPYVPGSGVAGTVSAIGAGVEADWIGRDVVTDTRETGSYAERVAVPADGLVLIPDELTASDRRRAVDRRPHRARHSRRRLGERRHPGADHRRGGRDGAAARPAREAARGPRGRCGPRRAEARGGARPGRSRGDRLLSARLDGPRPGGARRRAAGRRARWSRRGDRPGGVRDHRRGRRVLRPRRRLRRLHTARRATPRGSAASPSAGSPTCSSHHEEGARRLRDVLAQAAAGRVAPVIGRTYPLEDAAEAHRRIEAREVVGKSLLLVNGTSGR